MPEFSLQSIAPAAVRYIKLGEGGRWEAAALDGGTVEFGFQADSHELAAAGDWDGLRSQYREQGLSPGTATRYTNELKAFYTLGADTLWVTFARGSLWWAFAEPEVLYRGESTHAEGSRYRRTIGPWRSTDIAGNPLRTDALSTRLTQVAAYRGTICSVNEEAYLLGRINVEPQPMVTRTAAAREALTDSVGTIIANMHWAEFELLVDLIFTRSGWRRVSVVGGTMKDIDLLLEQPLTGERIAVQVKSRAGQGVLDDCVAAFEASGLASRFYFVCHSAVGTLAVPPDVVSSVAVWGMAETAAAAVDVGLVGWVLEKAA